MVLAASWPPRRPNPLVRLFPAFVCFPLAVSEKLTYTAKGKYTFLLFDEWARPQP